MNMLTLQVFVSLMLVVSSLVLFAYSIRQRDHEHADRLCLLPLEEERHTPPQSDTSLPPSGGSMR